MAPELTGKIAKTHPLFYVQLPLLLLYAPFSDLKSYPTPTHRVFDQENIEEAMKRVTENGAFYFSELHRLKSAEREQAALDYHLLAMETEKPSQTYVDNARLNNVYLDAEDASDFVMEEARTLCASLLVLDPDQELSLKRFLNQGIYSGDESFLILARSFSD